MYQSKGQYAVRAGNTMLIPTVALQSVALVALEENASLLISASAIHLLIQTLNIATLAYRHAILLVQTPNAEIIRVFVTITLLLIIHHIVRSVMQDIL